MESYVVRIYRRDPASEDALVGTVEVVGSGRSYAFRDGRHLLDLLMPAANEPGSDAAAEPAQAPERP